MADIPLSSILGVGSGGPLSVEALTQSEYDALTPPDENTAYLIEDDPGVVSFVYLGSTLVWPEPVVPANTSSPIVTGAVYVDDTASTTNGTWTGSPSAYEYKWQENDSGWTDVLGETASTFADIPLGEYRSAVRAQNDVGWSDWAYSTPFIVSEPATGLSWAGGWRVALAGNEAVRTAGGGDYGHAYTDPLTGLCYVEFEVDMTTGAVDVGLWARDDVSSDPGAWGDFSYVGGSSLKVNVGGYWANNYYGDAGYLGGPEPNHTDDPVYRAGLAFNAMTGAAWLRDVWSSGASAWYGGGNPATGTTPTFTLDLSAGFEDIRLAASFDATGETAYIVPSDGHYGTAPSGFTPV